MISSKSARRIMHSQYISKTKTRTFKPLGLTKQREKNRCVSVQNQRRVLVSKMYARVYFKHAVSLKTVENAILLHMLILQTKKSLSHKWIDIF